jgi:hypothetical protein
MIHHVETRHLFEYWNEPFARVALKTDKYQTRVKLHALLPRRPALGGHVGAVVIGIRPPQYA